MDLYIIRHGESQGNVGLNIENPELTDLGKKQAELLALRLRNIKFDAILSSPLKRAVQTATPLAELQKTPITVLENLYEVGAFGDESLEEVQERAKKAAPDGLAENGQRQHPNQISGQRHGKNVKINAHF